MRICRKLVSTVGGKASLLSVSKCSFCESGGGGGVARVVGVNVSVGGVNLSSTTMGRGYATRPLAMKTDALFPSSRWRRLLQNNSFRRGYSSDGDKRGMEMGLLMGNNGGSGSTSASSSVGENTQKMGTCSISSPCSAVGAASERLFANRNRGEGSCGRNEDSNVNVNGASSMSIASSSAAATAAVSATFGISSAARFTPVRTVVTSRRLVEVTRDGTMEQPKLMSKEEREEFMSVYHSLVKELLEIPDMKDMAETNRWMARVLQYNVPHGKRNRGLSTALAYKYFAPEELTEENVRLSYILGWCVEILQAFFLVSDDIMDESETRRGRPCWYKVDNLGLAAVNDAIMLESLIYQILRKHFSGKQCYAKVMEVMHDVTYKTIFGQSLDTRTGQDRRMETYTMERYSSIVKYKTSYYSFYLPVALAMTLCEIKDPNLYQQVRKVTLEMGHFFQVQDDYLDCFGDEEVTGKIGTDIQDCKCSWLFVTAVQKCNPDQKKFLLQNYGENVPAKIEAVKGLYKELGLEDVYHEYEESTYNLICTHIQQMNEELPKGLFQDMLHKIYKRSS